MSEILVTIDNPQHQKHFISLLNELKYISSFKKIKSNGNKPKPLTDEDWVRPGRPATDEEITMLIESMENDKSGVTTEEVRKNTLKELDEWITHSK
jgi:hypothetical protein